MKILPFRNHSEEKIANIIKNDNYFSNTSLKRDNNEKLFVMVNSKKAFIKIIDNELRLIGSKSNLLLMKRDIEQNKSQQNLQ